MLDNSINKSKDIVKKIEDIMKCDICNIKYDYNIHKPMVLKCGHTFCKTCIYNSPENNKNNDLKQKKIFNCPIDDIPHIFNIDNETNGIDPSIYQNLKLEVILKEILNISEPTIKEKYIVYSKPDMKRNKSPENSHKNTLNNNSDGNLIDNNNKNNINNLKNRDNSNSNSNNKKNINIKINSGNQIINVNAINVNIDTRDILKKEEKNNINNSNELKTDNNNNNNELKTDNNNINNNNNNNNNNDSMLNDELNTLQINEEINVNDGKLNFENEKINDDSIETIPLNEEKSMTNMSFRDDFKELLNKNYEFKNQVYGNLKTDENNNNDVLLT